MFVPIVGLSWERAERPNALVKKHSSGLVQIPIVKRNLFIILNGILSRMERQAEEMTIVEAIEERDVIDEKIQKLFDRRKHLQRKIKSHLPLLDLMGETEEKETLI